MVEYDSVKVKDQLGRPEDKNITVKRFTQDIIIEDNALTIIKDTIGNSWIVGSSTNGIVGTNTGTQGGGQQVVGGSGRVQTLQHVINSNKIFRERFIDTNFEDSSETTADWGSAELSFTTGEIAQSESVAYADGTITKATINVTATSGDTDDLAFQLTADGGSHWENVTLGTEHNFTNTGTDLRFKITASGTVVLSFLRIQYG